MKEKNNKVKENQSNDFIIGSTYKKAKKMSESEEMKKLHEETTNSYKNLFFPKTEVKVIKHKKNPNK